MNIVKANGYRSITSAPGRKIEYIVIHYTAGVTSHKGSAMNTADWFNNPAAVASSDFIVDDAEVVQYNNSIKKQYTWHCGGVRYPSSKGGTLYGKCLNKNSIGVEICSTNSTRKMKNANDPSYSFTQAVVDNAVELVKELMKQYNIDSDHVVRHYDCTGKPCPGIYGWNADSGSEAEWEKFKARIADTSTQPTQPKKMYYVQVGAFASKENADKFLVSVKKDYPNAFIKEI